jgi:hypothetical protein
LNGAGGVGLKGLAAATPGIARGQPRIRKNVSCHLFFIRDRNHCSEVENMPFTIDSNQQEQFFIKLENEPDFVHSLSMAPPSREPMLDEGDWLVLAFAVWSVSDVSSVSVAIEFAKSLRGQLNVGLRPFESADEFRSWCEVKIANSSLSDVQTEGTTTGGFHIRITGNFGSSPIWLCFRNSVTVGEHHGVLDVRGLRNFTNDSFLES